MRNSTRVLTALVAGGVLLAGTGAAVADTVAIDGDGVDTSNSKNSKFALCSGAGSHVDIFATVNYTGTGKGDKHFSSGGTVTITTSVPAAAAGFLTAAGGSVVTSNWDHTSDSVTSEGMRLSVDTDWVAGTYEVAYTVSGTDQHGDRYVLNDKNNVKIEAKTTGCSTTGGGGGSDEGGGGTPPPPANTAPTVNVTGVEVDEYEIGSVPTAGCSVVDAEDTNESATPVVGPITGPLAAYGLGSVTVTCSYTDGGGLGGEDDVTYTIVDTGLPTITDRGPMAAANGANGWYVSPVTNTFRATDTGAGFTTTKPGPNLLTYDFTQSSPAVGQPGAEGSAVLISSGTVTDAAGNVGAAIDSAPFKIDLSDPLLNITGAASGASNVCDSAPARPSFAPTDAISLIDPTRTSDTWTPPSTATGVGTYTYTATAFDNAGRDESETRTYTRTYGAAFGGIQQPINGGLTPDFGDDNSRVKLGSTLPVKFKLTCGTTPITDAVAKLTVKLADTNPDAGVDEVISTAAATTGNLFRYDSTSGQYIFNLNTKAGYTNPDGTTTSFTSMGTYRLSILLDDSTSRSVNVQMVK